jgi:hypothetical protein
VQREDLLLVVLVGCLLRRTRLAPGLASGGKSLADQVQSGLLHPLLQHRPLLQAVVH